jgi:hypothetical protein
MTFFIQLEKGQPVGNAINELNLRQLYPNTSFPRFFTADAIEPLGYGIYDFANQPELERYKKAVEVAPVRSGVGIWRQTWDVVEMDQEEKDAENKRKSQSVRDERTGRLMGSDWTQLPDAPVDTAAWATYRQELRDVTAQVGFPWEVVWPEKP